MTSLNAQLSAAQRVFESAPDDEPEGLLDDCDEAREFILDSHSEAFIERSMEMLFDWIDSSRDKFAEAKLLRQTKELADWIVARCEQEDQRRIDESLDMRDDYREMSRGNY